MKENYGQILNEIDELIKAYRSVPVIKKVEKRKTNLQDYLKRGMLALPDETPAQESDGTLRMYQNQLDYDAWKLKMFLMNTGFVRVDEDSLEQIKEVKERTYGLGEEIRNHVKEKEIPKGYGHEILYLETAKGAYETSKKAAGLFEELKPFEGKKVLLSKGKPVTLKRILKEGGEELKKKCSKRQT